MTVRPAFTREERLQRAALRVAMHIRGLWEERGSSDTRLLDALLMPDELTIAGRSRAWSGKGRREHVVPRRVIIVECHRLLEAGAPDEALAAFIAQHTRIVLITREECERLDRADALGLRQRMPEGWRAGDDIYARLRAAEILWDPIGLTTASVSDAPVVQVGSDSGSADAGGSDGQGCSDQFAAG